MSERHTFTPDSARPDAGAAQAPDASHAVGNRNRWSRVVFAFERLIGDRWYEFNAYMICAAAEGCPGVRDFAAIGVAFRAQDQSEIDFGRIPGLARTSIDAHGDWIAGPMSEGGAGSIGAPIRCRFYLPAPAAQVGVTIRSWRNTHPFRIVQPEIRQAVPDAAHPEDGGPESARGWFGQDSRIVLGPRPAWLRHGLVPGRALVFKGQVIAQGQSDGALAQVSFRDARGNPIPPPYPGTLATLSIPAFLDIPVHREAYRFTLKVSPPPQAATVEIGFATWDPDARLALAAAPDVFLDDELRLANLAEEAGPDAEAVLAHLLGRLGAPRPTQGAAAGSILPYLDPALLEEAPSPLRSVALLRDGPDAAAWADGSVSLASCPAWALPEVPDWGSDPFRSHAWRLAFQSLSWTCAAAGNPERAVRDRAVAVALAWSRANPWGRPADTLSLHPACMAMRLEAMLCLLGAAMRDGDAADRSAVERLGAEIVRHAAALAEILAQHTVAGSLLEAQVAASLMAAGVTLPAFPMARHWTDLAMIALRSGFEAMIDPEGAVTEPSYHRRLEILTLALVLMPVLKGRPDLAPLADILDLRLARAWGGLIALLEPDGALPPFDDAPGHTDRYRWMGRVAAAHRHPWMTGPAVGPTSGGWPRPGAPIPSGTILLRRTDAAAGWSAFTADFSEQIHPQDHRDCTSFTFATGGLRWITERGGSQAEPFGPRGLHPAAARAHNIAIPEGREPGAGVGTARATLTLGEAAVHLIETSVHGPDYRHIRAFVLLNDLAGMAVFDRFLTGDRPLSVEGFLHFDPSVVVALDPSHRIFGLRGERRLHIVPHGLAGRIDDIGVHRPWAESPAPVPHPRAGAHHRARPGPCLRYTLSGVRCVAGGLLIAGASDGIARLMRAVEAAGLRRRLTE